MKQALAVESLPGVGPHLAAAIRRTFRTDEAFLDALRRCDLQALQRVEGISPRRAVELVGAGIIGDVTEAHIMTNRPIWPQGMESFPPKADIPKHLDWDLWLGPAPKRDYAKGILPFNWRGWWDYGTGALGDMACHTANLAYMACQLTQPNEIEDAGTGPINSETFPAWASINMKFPEANGRGPIDFHWYEGKVDLKKKNLPPMDLFHGEKPTNSGSLIVGDKGILYSPNDYGSRWKVYADGKWKNSNEVDMPKPYIPRNGRGDGGMKEEWVKAIREGKPEIAMSNFE